MPGGLPFRRRGTSREAQGRRGRRKREGGAQPLLPLRLSVFLVLSSSRRGLGGRVQQGHLPVPRLVQSPQGQKVHASTGHYALGPCLLSALAH